MGVFEARRRELIIANLESARQQGFYRFGTEGEISV
jgi:hypothetical protein